MISNTTVASPLVGPDVPTWYYVNLTDAIGLQEPRFGICGCETGVALNAGPDTTICQTDGIYLNPVSDGFYYQWTPATNLNNSTVKNPLATTRHHHLPGAFEHWQMFQ